MVIGVVCVLWVPSVPSELFQAAVVENERMCAWLTGSSRDSLAHISDQASQRLLGIRHLETNQISCVARDHGFNESLIETSLIVMADGAEKMRLRYDRPLHPLSPFIPNQHLGF